MPVEAAPLRVLHVLEALESGVARHVVDVVRHVEAEHGVVVPPVRVGGLTDTFAVDAMRAAGASVHLVDMRRSPVDHRNVAAVGRIRALIRRQRPAIVHGHSAIGGMAARLAAAGTGAATVYTPNGVTPLRAGRAVERLAGPLADRIVAVSPSEADLIARLRLARPDRVVVIPNGVELGDPGPPSCDLRGATGTGPGELLVGMVGRLVAQKAPEVFVRACALVARQRPEARFVLIGNGPLAAVVAGEVSRAGLDGRFVHLQDVVDAPTVVGQMDVFALSSRYEGGPYTPLEAMRAGVPVVLTDVIGSRDTVEHGISGLLVPPDDPAALAGALVSLLADRALRQRLGQGGRARVEASFDVRTMGGRLRELYLSLLKGR